MINEAEHERFRFADNPEMHSSDCPFLSDPGALYLYARFRKNVTWLRMYRDTPDLRANTGSTTRNRPRRFRFPFLSFFLLLFFRFAPFLFFPFFSLHFLAKRRRVI